MKRILVIVVVLGVVIGCVVNGKYKRDIARYRQTVELLVACGSNFVNGVSSDKVIVHDAWNRSIVLNTNAQEHVVLINSAGHDGVVGNSDDVVCKLELWGGRNYMMTTSWSYGIDSENRLDSYYASD